MFCPAPPPAWFLASLPSVLGLLAILGAPRALWLSDFLCNRVETCTGVPLAHVSGLQAATTSGDERGKARRAISPDLLGGGQADASLSARQSPGSACAEGPVWPCRGVFRVQIFRNSSSLCGPGYTPHGAAFWGGVVPQEGGEENKRREAAAGILCRDGGQRWDLLGAGEQDLPQRLHPVLLVGAYRLPLAAGQMGGHVGCCASSGRAWKPRRLLGSCAGQGWAKAGEAQNT